MRRRVLWVLTWSFAMTWLTASWMQLQAAPQRALTSSPPPDQHALLSKYCGTCHNPKMASIPGMALDKPDLTHIRDNAAEWEKVVRKLRAGMMPPSGAPRPDFAAMQTLTEWLENELDRHPVRHLPPPGLHRLNRTEYTNVIRDLLAVEVDAAKFLPPDDSTRGFDNIAAALGLSPALLDAYLSAAGKISRLAIGNVTSATQTVYRVPEDTTQNYFVEGLPFGTRGGIVIRHDFPTDGEYAIRVAPVNRGLMGGAQAFGEVKGERLEVLLDGARQGLFDWDREVVPDRGSGQPGTVDLRLHVNAGLHTVGVTFLATHYAPILDLNQQFERSTIETGGLPGFTFYPHIGSVRIDGPYSPAAATDTASRRKVFVCHPARSRRSSETQASEGGPASAKASARPRRSSQEIQASEDGCARQIISTLAQRAFRQPVDADDLRKLVSLYEAGRRDGTFDHGIELALQGILAHPKFIYRIEREPAGPSANEHYRIGDLDLASRLSFFLWSTLPDEELTNVARQRKLSDPVVLEQQTRRMLADARSEALIVNFAGQWLQLRALQTSYPVVQLFPDFDDNLRQAFRREVELFFGSIVREDRNVLDLLTADYTFVNERLARHYRIEGIYGSRFRRVTLGPELDARRGLLGKGAVLTVSSQPNRTSLVQRGKWILQNILGTQPPDPPPFNVPPLNATAEGGKVLTLRQQMEKHRAVEPCKSCHKIMDPIGLSLENFDAVGAWRTEDEGNPIDSSGVLVDGTPMNGVADLRQALLRYSDQFVRNVTERLMTYGLGRGVESYDMPAVRSIVRDARRDDFRFSSLIVGIVKSDAFQMNARDGEGRGVALK